MNRPANNISICRGNPEKGAVKSNLYDGVVFAFFYWFVLQDFVLGLFYSATKWELATNLLFYSKDVFLILFFVIALFKNRIPTKWLAFLAVWVGLLVFFFFLGYSKGMGLFSLASTSRSFLYLPCLVTIGFGVGKDGGIERRLDRFMRFLVLTGAFGILDMVLDAIVGTKDFWRNTVGLTAFLTDIKRQTGNLLYEGLPGNFYGDYSGVFFSQKRLVSFFANPLTSGYVLVIPYFYYLLRALEAKEHALPNAAAACFMFLVVTLTFTRAVILPMIALTFVMIFWKKPAWRVWLLLAAAAVFAAALALFYDKIMIYLFGGSTGAHYDALAGSLATLELFGQGIGMYGIYGKIGTESAYINILGQLGIFGLAVYLAGSVYVVRRVFRYQRRTPSALAATLLLLTVVYAITGFVSEQLFAYTTIAPYYLMCGMFLRRQFERSGGGAGCGN